MCTVPGFRSRVNAWIDNEFLNTQRGDPYEKCARKQPLILEWHGYPNGDCAIKFGDSFFSPFITWAEPRSYALINIRNRIPVSICNSLQYIYPWIRSQSVHIYKWISLKVTNFFILWAVVELAEAIITEEKRILRNLKTKIINRVQLQS